jgi:hypothetical protein
MAVKSLRFMCLLIRSVRFISWGGGSALILLLTSPIEADAQIIGGRIGVTLLDNMRGMTGGGYISFPLDRWFSLQPELLYSEKGARVTWTVVTQDPNTGEPTFVDQILHQDYRYLEVPLLATMGLPLASKFALGVTAGPSVALRVDCGWKLTTAYVSQFGEQLEAITTDLQGPCDEFKRTNFGFVLGGGAGLDSGRLRFTIDLRHSIDFSWFENHLFTATFGVGLRR